MKSNSFSFAVLPLTILLFSYLVNSTPLFPRVNPLRFNVLSQTAGTPEEDGGCSDYQIEYLERAIEHAHSWADASAEIFEKNIETLKGSQGAKDWLSPDGSIPTKQAFYDVEPQPQSTPNNLVDDAKIHLKNVAASFNLEAQSSQLNKVKKTLTETRGEEMNHEFFFACEPKQPRSHSRAFTYKKKAEKLKVEDAKKMVDNAIEEDRKAYDQYAKKPDCFPPPESAPFTLLHEAQHAKLLLHVDNDLKVLRDIPRGDTARPKQCKDGTYVKHNDKSRNAENWAIVAWLIFLDKATFLETPTVASTSNTAGRPSRKSNKTEGSGTTNPKK